MSAGFELRSLEQKASTLTTTPPYCRLVCVWYSTLSKSKSCYLSGAFGSNQISGNSSWRKRFIFQFVFHSQELPNLFMFIVSNWFPFIHWPDFVKFWLKNFISWREFFCFFWKTNLNWKHCQEDDYLRTKLTQAIFKAQFLLLFKLHLKSFLKSAVIISYHRCQHKP